MTSNHFQRGKQLIELGRLDAAKTEFASMLAEDPRSSTAHCYLAYVLYLQSQHDEAMKHLQTVFAEDPHNAWAYRIASSVMRRKNQLKKAENYARTALSYEPDGVYEHINMSIVHLVYSEDQTSMLLRRQVLDRLKLAREHAEKALSLDPAEPDAYHQAALVELRLSGVDTRKKAPHLQQAQTYLDEGLRLQADHTTLLVLKSQIHDAQSQRNQSIQVAMDAMRNDPQNARAQGQVQALLDDMSRLNGWAGAGLFVAVTAKLTAYMFEEWGWIKALPLCLLGGILGYSSRIWLTQLEIQRRKKQGNITAPFETAFNQWKKPYQRAFPILLAFYLLFWTLALLAQPHTRLMELQNLLYELSRILLLAGLVVVLGQGYIRNVRNRVVGGQNRLVGFLQALWMLRIVLVLGALGFYLVTLLPDT
ncbi:tetratricopeptide repeat protein [Deinococcus roseus]|uniref:Tetratricopeptide repeat protein n=1 Tax=Deinococcus roseus TaxID=392414 RepID=A0ABQ2CUC6_9DEIO|nr:tetratricopeptide repeat protein [Deinococcus roseus]GGJ18156.1 hypothetical protein GCM10008938_00350 [Deinococcus roseus]